MSGKKLLVAALVLVVAAAVVAGIAIIGPPVEERTRRLDERRVEHLRHISQSARLYHTRHKRVPGSLDELAREPGVSIAAADPVTGRPYEYRVFDATSYQLCASFDRETENSRSSDFWSHGEGRHCFTVDVNQTDRLER